MKCIKSISGMKNFSRMQHSQGFKIGFVPTMGYLHKGHLSLVEIAKRNADKVVVSIFVNPTQFGPNEDLDRYPRNINRDKKILSGMGVDALFLPSKKMMYPEGYLTYVEVERLSKILCGASRPKHFRGVTTVVLKLFNIIEPDIAVFGEKDYQQAVIIKRMVSDLNLNVRIFTGKIVREDDGIAMSSRNTYLSSDERKRAAVLYKSLLLAKDLVKSGEKNCKKIKNRMKKLIKSEGGKIDYVEIVHSESLESLLSIEDKARAVVAVWIGKTRLIDNMQLK